MFLPPEMLGVAALFAECAAESGGFEQLLRASIEREGWPPPPSARRTRVQLEGPMPCHACNGRFSKHWAFRGVCWRCEQSLRGQGECPFDAPARRAVSKARQGHPFCAHQGLCPVCDAGFRLCRTCRLAQGDGEAVLELCTELRPHRVFLDFDRTLCSTRAGASPLSGVHSLDPELASLGCLAQSYVVTRNSHADEIGRFLEARGMLIAGLCVTPKGGSKGEFIEAMLREGELGLFVDDSVQECSDPRIASNPNVIRVLFQRGAV